MARAPLQGAGIWARASGAAGTSEPEGRRADVYSHYGPGRGMARATPRHTGPSATELQLVHPSRIKTPQALDKICLVSIN